jgi:hypothetical protein
MAHWKCRQAPVRRHGVTTQKTACNRVTAGRAGMLCMKSSARVYRACLPPFVDAGVTEFDFCNIIINRRSTRYKYFRNKGKYICAVNQYGRATGCWIQFISMHPWILPLIGKKHCVRWMFSNLHLSLCVKLVYKSTDPRTQILVLDRV